MAVTSRTTKPARTMLRVENRLAWILQVGLYVVALVTLTLALSRGVEWSRRTLDDLRYGMPRTVHLTGVVGGGDATASPTRFIGLNLDGQVSVLVAPAGDSGRMAVLPGPYVIGNDGPAAVPLLSLADLTGDGASDLLLTIRGEMIVYVNHDGTFALLTPEERTQLELPPGE
ncbi:MAG: hypothetical protein HC822_14535 [Oscillochloris sp.]|nr:hypothetical protein [Oscillochloris sp.]